MRTNRDWVAALPEALDAQCRLLDGFLDHCERERSVRWLFVGCSLARGAADALSDLDLAVGLDPEAFAGTDDGLREALASLGELVALFGQDWPASCPVRRYFALYRDRTQIDLTVSEATGTVRLPAGVVLYDPAGLVEVVSDAVLAPRPEEVRLWAASAWEALLNLGKYVRRGSCWEARRQLEEARALLFQLWAHAEGVAQARYGVTALYDLEPPRLPVGIGRTLAGLHLAELAGAGRALGELLEVTQQRLTTSGAELPRPAGALRTRRPRSARGGRALVERVSCQLVHAKGIEGDRGVGAEISPVPVDRIRLDPRQLLAVIRGRIDKARLKDERDLMATPSLEVEEVLEDPRPSFDDDVETELFAQLASDRVNGALTDVDSSAEEPLKGNSGHGVVAGGDEDGSPPRVHDQRQREHADARAAHRSLPAGSERVRPAAPPLPWVRQLPAFPKLTPSRACDGLAMRRGGSASPPWRALWHGRTQ